MLTRIESKNGWRDTTVKPKVFIVGSGIIGASMAFVCPDFGSKVTVLEQVSLDGIASANSFRWVNASFAEN